MAQEKKYKISTVILTRDNERTIGRCLESVSGTGEIIVVDSLSRDKTLQIAGRYTDRIWQRPWPGYAPQWNFGIDKAGGDWILILASDECLTPELKEEIEGIVSGQIKKDGYFAPRKTYFLGKWIKHCGWYPDYSIRLFKNGRGRFDNKMVHEKLLLEGPAAYLKNPILHYSYSNLSEYLGRMNEYASLAARQMVEDKIKINTANMRAIVIKKTLKAFWKMYVRQAGFKDGMHGLVLSIFSAVYRAMVYSKYWELVKQNNRNNLDSR